MLLRVCNEQEWLIIKDYYLYFSEVYIKLVA